MNATGQSSKLSRVRPTKKVNRRKTKKMSRIKKFLRNKLNNILHSYDESEECSLVSTESSPTVDADPILHFKVFSAENGKIIEFRKYDHVKDKNNVRTYIVGKDEDISEKIGKCLSVELLR